MCPLPMNSPMPAAPESPASLFRHDLRNRLSTIRSAATFLSKLAARSGFDRVDPRIVAFLTLIEAEVGACDLLLGRAGDPATRVPPPEEVP